MVVIRPYEEDDVFKVKIRLGDPLGAVVGNYPGPAWTMEEDGEVLAVMGITAIASGIGLVWSFISDEARGHGKTMLKFGREKMKLALTEMRFHRLQAVVRADREEYQRFIELLGFEKEGLMRKGCANGDDLWLYSRIE